MLFRSVPSVPVAEEVALGSGFSDPPEGSVDSVGMPEDSDGVPVAPDAESPDDGCVPNKKEHPEKTGVNNRDINTHMIPAMT